ncbi:MAG TPA: hypothetical protein VM103_02320 [Candidatus Paceibacterota bacterium]|nr:hypothetical protein [Candidatus Paceibacterota bacterium]
MIPKSIVLSLLGLLMLAGVAGVVYRAVPVTRAPVLATNFEECVAAGNPVMESYPRQCRSANSQLFTEQITVAPAPTSDKPYVGPGCGLGGCSAQICTSEAAAPEMVSTCEYRAEYACYKSARCEMQTSGTCGWTRTAALSACLAHPPPLEGPTPM